MFDITDCRVHNYLKKKVMLNGLYKFYLRNIFFIASTSVMKMPYLSNMTGYVTVFKLLPLTAIFWAYI